MKTFFNLIGKDKLKEIVPKRKILSNKNGWSWYIHDEIIYLQSNLLLENGFTHAFFTKNSSINNQPETLNNSLKNNYSIHILRQIHSNKVIPASQSNLLSPIEGDSIISDNNFQSLWVYTADCIPILLADIKTRRVAAIHSGWRGLTKNIIKKTIDKLTNYGCKQHNLFAALGPSISASKYQVDINILNKIYSSIFEKQNVSKKEAKEELIAIGCINNKIDSERFYLDIRNVAKKQLKKEGLFENQIISNTNCTFSEANFFESWRRENTSRRQWSFIASTNLSINQDSLDQSLI